MLAELPKPVLVIGVAAVLFVVLGIVRSMVTPSERVSVSVQERYDELAMTLEEAKVLPLRSADELLMAFVNMTATQINEPETDAAGVTEIRLGEVLIGRAVDSKVYELEVHPQHWRAVRGGPLRETLRALSLLPLAKQNTFVPQAQAKGLNPVPHPSFYFDVIGGGQSYRCTPHFKGEQCEFIAIRPVR